MAEQIDYSELKSLNDYKAGDKVLVKVNCPVNGANTWVPGIVMLRRRWCSKKNAVCLPVEIHQEFLEDGGIDGEPLVVDELKRLKIYYSVGVRPK